MYTTMFMPVPVYMPPSTDQMDTSSNWSVPAHSKARQARPTPTKKLAGAVLPEEIEETKWAVQEAMKAHCQAPRAMDLKRGFSGSTCSTWEGVSETGDNDSGEGSCKATSDLAIEDSQMGDRRADTRFTDKVET